jgi:hypothetical protein
MRVIFSAVPAAQIDAEFDALVRAAFALWDRWRRRTA